MAIFVQVFKVFASVSLVGENLRGLRENYCTKSEPVSFVTLIEPVVNERLGRVATDR